MLVEVELPDGFHSGVTWKRYHDMNAVWASWLEALRRSPAACRLAMLGSWQDETKSLRLGRALHAAVLEPLSFDSQFALLEHKGNTKEGKAERRKLGERTGLTLDEWQSVFDMQQSLLTHPRVKKLLGTATDMEQTAIWTRNGRRCKAKRDLVGTDWLADIKTSADLERFSPYSVTNYGYHRQASWYLSAYPFLQLDTPQHFYFIVVANTAPFESAVYRIEAESVGTGIDETSALFETFLECERQDEWTKHEVSLLAAKAFRPLRDS